MIGAFSFLGNFQQRPGSIADWRGAVLGVESCSLPHIHPLIPSLWNCKHLRDITLSTQLIESTGKGCLSIDFWIWEPSSFCSVSFQGSSFHIYWVTILFIYLFCGTVKGKTLHLTMVTLATFYLQLKTYFKNIFIKNMAIQSPRIHRVLIYMTRSRHQHMRWDIICI